MDTQNQSVPSISPQGFNGRIGRANPPLAYAKRTDRGVTGEQPSRWITRERPKIERIACPWLFRRFIDTESHVGAPHNWKPETLVAGAPA